MDPCQSADAAGLRYVTDDAPGIVRRSRGRGHFTYLGPDGRALRDEATLRRIRALAIPPAWTNVWIAPSATAHLQATGRDAKGRKQYRYHARWRETRDATKFHRMIAFARTLPRARAQVVADLRRAGMPREKILAAAVRLLDTTLIRIGHEEYTRKNHSFGLTTLRDRHVQVRGETVLFRFRGKSGVFRRLDLRDRRMATVIRKCQELPGHELFHYLSDNGETLRIESGDVNEYLRALTGGDFTAKDFRTWAGTVLVALALHGLPRCASQTEAKRNVVRAIRTVSERLGNTPSVCRRCYVHPEVVSGYLDGQLAAIFARQPTRASSSGLRSQEAAVAAFLKERAKTARVARAHR